MATESKHYVYGDNIGCTLKPTFDKPMYFFVRKDKNKYGAGHPVNFETMEAAIAERNAFMQPIIEAHVSKFFPILHNVKFEVTATIAVLDALEAAEAAEAKQAADKSKKKKKKSAGGKRKRKRATEYNARIANRWWNAETASELRKAIETEAEVVMQLNLEQARVVKGIVEIKYCGVPVTDSTFALMTEMQKMDASVSASAELRVLMRADAVCESIYQKMLDKCLPIRTTVPCEYTPEFTCENDPRYVT